MPLSVMAPANPSGVVGWGWKGGRGSPASHLWCNHQKFNHSGGAGGVWVWTLKKRGRLWNKTGTCGSHTDRLPRLWSVRNVKVTQESRVAHHTGTRRLWTRDLDFPFRPHLSLILYERQLANSHATCPAPLKVLAKKDDWRHTSRAALTQTEHSKQHKQATFQPNNDFHSVCKRLEDFFQGRTEDHKFQHWHQGRSHKQHSSSKTLKYTKLKLIFLSFTLPCCSLFYWLLDRRLHATQLGSRILN